MDGVKRRLGQSIQLRLSLWLTIAVLLSAVAAGVFSFKAAFHEANEIQDLQLKEVAALVTAQTELAEVEAQAAERAETEAGDDDEARPEKNFVPRVDFVQPRSSSW